MVDNRMEPIQEKCQQCLKPQELCFCHQGPKCDTKVKILIIQHPQEPKELLSTTPLISSTLTDGLVKVGLSWPNFKKIIEDPTQMANQWAVVYLGSGIKFRDGVKSKSDLKVVNFVDKKGFLRAPTEQNILKNQIKGIIFIDGTWAQAKTLWWRNAWLTKLSRIVLHPSKASSYGKLRREPKKECLSTLESVAEVLEYFGDVKAAESLRKKFNDFLKKLRP